MQYDFSANILYIPFLYPSSVRHAAGRMDGKTVIVNVDMNIAAQNQAAAVDQGIYEDFKNTSLTVVGHLEFRDAINDNTA